MYKKFILLFIFFITFNAHAYLIDQIIEGDTLETIALRNIEKVGPRYTDLNEYMRGIKTWNPRVTDWDNLIVGTNLLVDYPYDLPKVMINNKIFTKAPTLLYSDDIGEKKLSAYLAFTTSFGKYSEVIDGNNITSTQNFPITFGMSFSYKIKENEKYLLASFYYAYSASTQISQNSTNSSSSIPPEIGANFYYQKFTKENFAYYGGLDFEKLNTFNTKDVINGEDVKAHQYNLIFGTLGVSKNIIYKKIPMGFKGSISPIFVSSVLNDKKLTGFKFILVYSIRPLDKINFNLFFKHHDVKGISDLKINRYGLGISFPL